MKNLAAPYRGKIQALCAKGNIFYFTTIHRENQPTALYSFKFSNQELGLHSVPLQTGGMDCLIDDKQLWIAGQNGSLYLYNHSGKPKAFHVPDLDDAPIIQLQLLDKPLLALLQSQRLTVLDRSSKKSVQSIVMDEPASVMAADPTGQYLVIGFKSGMVASYQLIDGQLTFSAKAAIHKSRVTALAFEANELRFYSAGTDKKLFSTHAQGELQPIDKAKNSHHKEAIQCIHIGFERFFTGANDRSIKSWANSGGRPTTIEKGLPKVTHLTVIEDDKKQYLIAAGDDCTFRVLPLKNNEAPTEVTITIRDGYYLAQYQLDTDGTTEHQEALQLLNKYDDEKAFKILTRTLKKEEHPTIRLEIIKIASASTHPSSTRLLESALKTKAHAEVRQQALEGLVKKAEKNSIRPYTLALESGFQDTGKIALQALAKLAKKDRQAEQALLSGLSHPSPPLNLFALSLLESVYGKKDPTASLYALRIPTPQLQRAALIRLYQRDFLHLSEAQRIVSLAQTHNDAWVRHTAFLIALLSRPLLADALKSRDENLDRQLQELAQYDLLQEEKDTKPPATSRRKKSPAVPLNKLSDDDYTPLLQSMTNPHTDICFAAGFALATLEDQRAFGLLLLLSQEKDNDIRMGVCRGLAQLQQSDAIPQLQVLLDDRHDGVRDAAFNAINALASDAFATLDIAFQSKHEDIHRRALKLLLDKAAKPTQKDAKAINEWLQHSLNNPFDSIRQETFKTCLKRQLGGDAAGTLQLLLNSRYENIHDEVLQEVLGNINTEWAQEILYQLLDDEFSSIRESALHHALTKKKLFDRQRVLQQAVKSRFQDMRLAVLSALLKRPTHKDTDLLTILLQDDEQNIRLQALQAVILSGLEAPLIAALDSQHEDIQVQAALACAAQGDARSYAIFEKLIQREKPKNKTQQENWAKMMMLSLNGLALLGDSNAFAAVLKHAQGNDDSIAMVAAGVLPWISDHSHQDQLLPLLKSDTIALRANAALALALRNESQGMQILANKKVKKQLSPHHQMAATITHHPANAATLQDFILKQKTHHSGMFMLFCQQLLEQPGQPELCIQGLSIPHPQLQRHCADLLSCFHDNAARWTYLQQWFSQHIEQPDKKPWSIPLPALQQIAALLVYGEPVLRARFMQWLTYLDNPKSLNVAQWKAQFASIQQRYEAELQAAAENIPELPETLPDAQRWQQLAFGAYLGLLRSDSTKLSDSANLNIKKQAIAQMAALGAENKHPLRQGVTDTLLTLLNHRQQAVRQQAYDQLLDLTTIDTLSQAAMLSPHEDMGRAGLRLITENSKGKQAHKTLQQVIANAPPPLAEEAFKLLLQDETAGLIVAAEHALQSHAESVRMQCVQKLAEQYDDKKAQNLLVKATQSEYLPAAIAATRVLTQHQHAKALPCLISLWVQAEDQDEQSQLLRIARNIASNKVTAAVEFFLNCIDDTKHLKVDKKDLYATIAEYRNTRAVPPLLQQLQQPGRPRRVIRDALLVISGFDQPLEDNCNSNTEPADTQWLDQQHPRHGDVLVNLFASLTDLGEQKLLDMLLPGLCWIGENPQADQALLEATAVVDENRLTDIINVVTSRARRRNGSIEALLNALSHKSPEIQFIAAEGLARNGHTQGNSILLSAADYLDDVEMRQRAILALGESGDTSLFDHLLGLAQNQEHALHEAATEAIAHLANSDQEEKILKLLQTSLKSTELYSDIFQRALNGLRWLNTQAAWETLCDFIADETRHCVDRAHALTLLRHWDHQRSRDILLTTLKESVDLTMLNKAYDSAITIWPLSKDSASPVDLALMLNHIDPEYIGDDKTVERVARFASTTELLALLNQGIRCTYRPDIAERLTQSLQQRHDHDPGMLAQTLATERQDLVTLAAQITASQPKPHASLQQALEQALPTHYAAWQKAHRQAQQDNDDEIRLDDYQQVVEKLLWAAVIQRVDSTVITDCLGSHEKAEQPFQQIILTAVMSLPEAPHASLLSAVEALHDHPNPSIQRLAQQILQQHQATQTLNWSHFMHQPELLDEASFQQSIADSARGEQQALALPVLIHQQAVDTLADIANDASVAEAQRLGAIEGLGRILTPEAEQQLQNIYQQHKDDEDLAKASFRALRRNQRAQQKQQINATHGAAV